MVARRLVPFAPFALFALLCGCERPYVQRDGTLLFPEKGAGGAAVVTANGLEFHDRNDVPVRIISRDPNEPWRAPIGFILPQSGRFTETSRPTVVATTGLAVVLRPSDTRVPSWGGEVLVRIDVIAPAAQGTARMGEDLAIVIDGDGDGNGALAAAALEQLAGRDRLAVIDAASAQVVVPSIPASHRSLALAAVEKRIHDKRGARNLLGALRLAATAFAVETKGASAVTRRVLVLSDGKGDSQSPAVQSQLEAMASAGIIVSAIASNDQADINSVSAIGTTGAGVVSTDPGLEDRIRAVKNAIPAAGKLSFNEVTLTFEGTPAPSHVLEASGGDVVWRLDAGELVLGDVHAGEARTEIVRVTVPAWVPHENFVFTVTAHYVEVEGAVPRNFSVQLPCVYDDDIERIANSRHGDVIAYASALATLRKLDAAFVGDGVNRAGGLRALAQLHARSMTLLARDTRDAAIIEQAEVLNALLSVSH